MSIEHLNKLEHIANLLVNGQEMQHLALYDTSAFYLTYVGKVVAKERARGENFYTPKTTRDFEAKLKKLARIQMRDLKLSRFYRCCIVHLSITDELPEEWSWWQKRLATSGMIFNTAGGDLDNKEKAILDAFNGVVFDDDRLIVQVYKFRHYGPVTGFSINIAQTGLTKNDLESIKRFIGNRNATQASS